MDITETKPLVKGVTVDLSRWRKPLIFSIAVLLAIVWGVTVLAYCIPESDWRWIYLPAVRDMMQFNSPYIGHSAFNPFWAYILLVPIALLPPAIGNAVIGLVCMFSLAFVAHKMGAKPLSIALLLTLPQVRFLSINGGIDWLIPIGFILPPQIGLFFVMIKPQVGILVAAFWFVEALRKGGIKQVYRVFLPVAIAYGIGYALFGMDAIWRGSEFLGAKYPWDATTFPYSIAVGLVLLVMSIRSRNIRFAIPASQFIAPYVAFYSWPVALFSIINDTWLMAAASFGMWIWAAVSPAF